MKHALVSSVLATALFCSGASGADRAGSPNPHLGAALEEIRGLQEKAALRTLERARAWPGNTPHEVTLYHLYAGLAHAGLGRSEKAIEHFRTALIIEPELELPAGISPRVIDWFGKAGGRVPRIEAPPSAPLVVATPAVQPAPALPPSKTRPRWRTWSGIGALAVGGIGLGAAVVFGVTASREGSRARSEPGLDRASALHQSAMRRARTSNLLYGTGGAVALGGGLLLIW